jgi:hypothetical protein
VAPNPDLLFKIMDLRIRIRINIYGSTTLQKKKLDFPHLGFGGGSKEEVCRIPASSGGGGGMQRGLGPSANIPLNQTGFRIRIHFLRIRIRIQWIRMEANTDPDTDPDPIRIQGFNDQKLKKNNS